MTTTKKVKLPSFPSFKKKKQQRQEEEFDINNNNNNDKSAATSTECRTMTERTVLSSSSSSSSSSYLSLMDLSDDLLMNVLTFVSDVPFEGADMDYRSSLTHTLPYINKHMHALCQQDFLWRMALLRLLKREPYLWEEGVHRVFKNYRRQSRRIASTATADSSSSSSLKKRQKMTNESMATTATKTREEKLMDDTIEQMLLLFRQQQQQQQQSQCTSSKPNHGFIPSFSSSPSNPYPPVDQHMTNNKPHLSLFHQTVSTHLKQTHPIFYMPGTVRLGRVFGLHFFEPRYRLLISEVMSKFPMGFRRGEAIAVQDDDNDDEDVSNNDGNNTNNNTEGRFPEFIYAHVAPLARTSPACIAQVRQCHIYPDGTADVLLMPAAYVWIERVWERPNSGGLAYGRVVRMGSDASRALERSVWSGYVSRYGSGHEEEEEEEEEYNEEGGVVGDGDGVRGSIHAILAYLTAREQGMQDDEE